MTQNTAKTICVTFVCSANTCRSPMLKYMFASYVKNANQEFENQQIDGENLPQNNLKTTQIFSENSPKNNLKRLQIDGENLPKKNIENTVKKEICCFSAGLSSSICPMAENTKTVLKKRNIQFVDTLSQEINEEIFAFSNFIFCMNDEILKAVENKFCDINLKNINSQFCDTNLKNNNSQFCDTNKISKPTSFDSSKNDCENVPKVLNLASFDSVKNDCENVPKVLNLASFDSTKNDGENVPKVLNLAVFNNGVEIFDPYGMSENAYETVANIFDNIIPKIYKFVLTD